MASTFDLAGRRTRLTWPDSFYIDYDYLTTGEMAAVHEKGATSDINPASQVVSNTRSNDLVELEADRRGARAAEDVKPGGMTGARASRSTRMTVAPWSASIIPANGAGPIPASSTMRIPESILP